MCDCVVFLKITFSMHNLSIFVKLLTMKIKNLIYYICYNFNFVVGCLPASGYSVASPRPLPPHAAGKGSPNSHI